MPATQFDHTSQRRKHAFLFLVFYWATVPLWGRGILPGDLFPDRRSTANGLAYNEVTCFFQDNKGFTWIGTEYGLSRFDGRKFKNYQHQKGNPNSLPHARIVSVSQLADGRMAIGTEQGFCFLSPDNEQFETYTPNNALETGLKGAYYCRIFQDSKKRIWVFSLDGLYLFDMAKKRVNAYHNPVPHPTAGTQLGNRMYAMAEDRKGNLWVGTSDGLFLFEPQKNEWKRAFDPSQSPDYLKFGALIADIAIHPNGTLFFTWFEMGLHRLEHTGKPPRRVDAALPGNQVAFGSWQGKLVCWYKAGGALRVANADSLRFEEVKNLTSEDHKAALVSTVYSDRENRLWLGFSGKGFGWLDAGKQRNHLFTNQINSRSFSTITAVLEENNRIWVANYHGNDVSAWDIKTGRRLWHQTSLQKSSETHTSVGHILSIPGKNYWFSTLCGLFHYAENEDQWEHFQPRVADPVELFRKRRFIKALPAGDKGLWVLTYAHKLCYFDLKTSSFHFLGKGNSDPQWSLALSRVEDMATDASGTLWMVGDGQLLSQKPTENQFTVRFQKPGLSLQTLAFAPDGSMWIATNEGLLHGDAKATSFQMRSFGTICPVETIESMVIDSKNRLWFSHLKGITVFDPQQGKSRQFNSVHGLPQDHVGGIQAGNNEKIWYFGDKLLGWIDAKNLDFETAALPIHLTSVSHLGKSLYWSLKDGKATLSLPHYMNDIEVGFSAINYHNPMETRYFYRIEGHDSAWKEVNDGKISFSNLAPGEYRVFISGSGGDTPTGQAGFLSIVVNPPFWETWWFRLGALAFAALGIYLYLNQRIKKIKTEAEAKTAIEKEMAELQMRALRTQMNPHFLFNSFNAIQECVVMGKTQEAVLYLAKFAKLVRLILEHSDKALIPLNQEIEVIKNYLEVEGLRFSEKLETNIEVHTHLDSSLLQIPPMLVQPFVENAIWHGLIKKEGEKKLLIRFLSTEEYLSVVIEDNGIGRKKAAENQSGKPHRSMATSIIEDRFKRMGNTNLYDIKIEDLADQQGHATGTRITLKLAIFG